MDYILQGLTMALSFTNGVTIILSLHSFFKATQKVGIRLNQPTQRVVLATQGGQLVTQQIIVPQGFQGGAFNIKRLKVIPVSTQQKGKFVVIECYAIIHGVLFSRINTTTTNCHNAK